MAEADNEAAIKQALEDDNDKVEQDMFSDVDYLHNELANVNRKLEAMHLALGKARLDHKIAVENKDNDIHKLQETLNNMQETVDRLKFEKERLYSKGRLRECDMTELKREIGNLKLQLEETEGKAKRREDINAILMAQEREIKEELKDELKEEMDRNTQALHKDMLAVLKEVQAEKKDVAAFLQEIHEEKKVAEEKKGMHKKTNKGNYHKNCLEKAHY